MNPKIAGTYWYVNTLNGDKWICQYNSIHKVADDSYVGDIIPEGKIGWLLVSEDDYTYTQGDGAKVTSDDFEDIVFPDTPKNIAVEIEIGKSGKVWVYD